MGKFVSGALTGFGLAIPLITGVLFLLWPQYSDYRSVAQTSVWIAAMNNENIIDAIDKRDTNAEIFKSLNDLDDPPSIFITDSNVLILKGGGEGQVLIFIPNIENNIKNIYCIGGSNDAMPMRCRDSKLNTLR